MKVVNTEPFNRLPLCLLLYCITLELSDFYRLAQQVVEFSVFNETGNCPDLLQQHHGNAIRRLHLHILHILAEQLL